MATIDLKARPLQQTSINALGTVAPAPLPLQYGENENPPTFPTCAFTVFFVSAQPKFIVVFSPTGASRTLRPKIPLQRRENRRGCHQCRELRHCPADSTVASINYPKGSANLKGRAYAHPIDLVAVRRILKTI